MKIRKLFAATVLTIAATGVTAATAYGSPLVGTEETAGADHGVEYTASVAPDRSSATMTLASGRFEITPDAGISVIAPDGAVVATVPSTLSTVTGQQVTVLPEVDAAATTLTLTPVGAPARAEFIGDVGTTVSGVLIGCAIGALIGLIFLFIGFIPGCVIGGIIGGVIGANQ